MKSKNIVGIGLIALIMLGCADEAYIMEQRNYRQMAVNDCKMKHPESKGCGVRANKLLGNFFANKSIVAEMVKQEKKCVQKFPNDKGAVNKCAKESRDMLYQEYLTKN